MYKLIIQDDEGKTTVVPLIRDEITIGRKEGNTIRLTERNVSRRHARIIRSNGTILVEDLDSYNGIRVNGTRIQGRVQVAESDRIQIGDYLLELKFDRGAQAGDPFADQRTQPMERPELFEATSEAIPSAKAAPASSSPSLSESAKAVRSSAPSFGSPAAAGGSAEDNAPTAVVHQSQVQGAGTSRKPVAQGSGEHAAVPATVPALQPDVPGRLVIVSSNFAGREFQLDRPAMVIGRTDDNDIVINHRSISRHHAKIVREHGRYAIVDLQSSNGVRVNGEEYGKVELRRGDLIDLGHVRLRFVEPGEDFVFDRDAHVVHMGDAPRGSRGILFAVLALAVVGGGAAILLLGKSEPPPAAPAVVAGGTAPRAGTGPAPAPPVPTPPTPGPEPGPAPAAPPEATNVGGVAKFLQDARRAAEEERWDDELAFAKLALAEQPENEEAKLLAEQARKEMRNKVVYDEFLRAARAGNVEEARRQYVKLPDDSYYKPTAMPELERLRDDLIAQVKRAVTEGRCDRAIQLARRAYLFPEARPTVDGYVGDCRPPQVAVKEREPKDKSPVDALPPPPPPGSCDFEALWNEARDAANSGQYSRALAKAEAALDCRPNEPQALTIAALASCRLKNEEKAIKYIGRLKGQRQQAARQVCLQAGVTIP